MLVKQYPITINGVEHMPADRDASAVLVHLELCETDAEFHEQMQNLSPTEIGHLSNKILFKHKTVLYKLREVRLDSVLSQPRLPDDSFKQHMIRNGYKPLPRNRYDDLVITVPEAYYFLDIRSF